MHPQFYAWYHQTMPLILLYTDDVPVVFKLMVYGIVEIFIDIDPSVGNSIALLIGHIFLLLFSLLFTKYPSPYLSIKKDI